MIFQAIGKLKQTTIMIAIVVMAFGIIALICPAAYVTSFIDVIGYVILVLAGVMVLDFIASKKTMSNYISFTLALLLLISGASILVFSDDIMTATKWVFGILLIMDGIHSLFYTMMYVRRAGRKGWWVLMILSIMLAVAGLISILNPWWTTTEDLMRAFGLALIFASIVGVIRLIFVWPLKSEEGGLA